MGFWVEDDNAAEHEQHALHVLEDQLHAKFPSVPDGRIDDVVERHYHELDGSPVREYVPVLVEHAAVNDLRKLAPARPVARAVQ